MPVVGFDRPTDGLGGPSSAACIDVDVLVAELDGEPDRCVVGWQRARRPPSRRGLLDGNEVDASLRFVA